MNYSDAITAVGAGKYCWRAGWTFGWYIHETAGQILIYEAGGSGTPYHATAQDQAATDWAEGDRPPHGK